MFINYIWISVVYIALQVAHFVSTETNPYLEALSKHPWQSTQKYVEVRPGAFLFYWFYYADGTSLGAEDKPLLIWIQGGPGFAASGLANFAEIGPINMDMQPRNHTWVNGRNVLLIDHPVSTGFSYATNKDLLAKDDREMGIYPFSPNNNQTQGYQYLENYNNYSSNETCKCSKCPIQCYLTNENPTMDLSKVIKAFYRHHKNFRRTPTYIFGQSYGGKICPRLAYYLHTAIKKNSLKMNFKGIGIGSGWVDPKESSLAFPTYLYNMGVLDQNTYMSVMNVTKEMCNYIDKQRFPMARKLESLMLQILVSEAGSEINFNNINQVSPYPALEQLSVKINKYVKPTLSHIVNQSLEWNYRSEEAYDRLNESFLVPSTKFLEMVLNTTNLKVAVYNGNLDIVTPLAGATNWVHNLRWDGAEEFKNKKRTHIRGYHNGYYKKVGRLSYWSVFGSGHWVPEDNPEAMGQILDDLISEDS